MCDLDESDSDDDWVDFPVFGGYNIKQSSRSRLANDLLAAATDAAATVAPPTVIIATHFSPTSQTSPTASTRKRRRLGSSYTFREHDEVILSGSTTTTLARCDRQRCQIQSVRTVRTVRTGCTDGVTNETYYYLTAEDARPYDEPIIVKAKALADGSVTLTPWEFEDRPTTVTEELRSCANLAGVSIVACEHGLGLQADVALPTNHLIPYWGKLSSIERHKGTYNCKIAESIFVIADDPADRGPGAFCNDATVRVSPDGRIHATTEQANAQLSWTAPSDTYLEEWSRRQNDGSQFRMYVETTRPVCPGEMVTLCYGEANYWNDSTLGTRLSNAILI
jgi:hypothetical protein